MVDYRVEGFREVDGDCFVLMSSHFLTENVLSEIRMSSITEKIKRNLIKLAEYNSLCYFLTNQRYRYGAIVRFQSLTVHVTDQRNNGGFPFALDVAGYSAVTRSF